MLLAKHRCSRLLLAGCECFSGAAETAADRQSAYNCAIGQSPGITVKFTTSTVAAILTDPSPESNLTIVNVSILGYKQHNFLVADRKL
ncbi:hypothetical protein [Microcoleus sp. B4-D4]|uniref:hypothetical protein n=1 Tax=Microcoleus sp. B4-D4 TaxID=2818667 RepID=UPI002FD5B93D